MAIEGIGRSAAPRAGTRARGPTASGFTLPDETASAANTASASAATPVALTSMLTLQELGGDEAVADREARRHGQDGVRGHAIARRQLIRRDRAHSGQ